jgi:hypothetical protein
LKERVAMRFRRAVLLSFGIVLVDSRGRVPPSPPLDKSYFESMG